MKGASWYIIHEGRKLLAATKAEAKHLAQLVADATGRRVVVRPIKQASRKTPAKRPLRRNPFDLDIPAYAHAAERARRGRLDYLAATKARRLAKGLHGRDRGGKVKAAERAAQKTGKFAVDVRGKINGVLQNFTLYRASRRAAEDVADMYAAAGCKVALREV